MIHAQDHICPRSYVGRSIGISMSLHIKTKLMLFYTKKKNNMIEEKDEDDFGKRKVWNSK